MAADTNQNSREIEERTARSKGEVFLQLPKVLEAEENEDCTETPELKRKHCIQKVNKKCIDCLILGMNLITNLISRKMQHVLFCVALLCSSPGLSVHWYRSNSKIWTYHAHVRLLLSKCPLLPS